MRVDERARLHNGEPVFKAGGIPLLAIAYVVGEFLTFGWVSDSIGFFPAFMLALGKSIAGFMILGAFMRKMLTSLAQNGGGILRMQGSGIGLRLLGALFLVLPGFLSGIIALALLLPGIRDLFANGPQRKSPDGVIELSADDWREVEDGNVDRRKKLRKPQA